MKGRRFSGGGGDSTAVASSWRHGRAAGDTPRAACDTRWSRRTTPFSAALARLTRPSTVAALGVSGLDALLDSDHIVGQVRQLNGSSVSNTTSSAAPAPITRRAGAVRQGRTTHCPHKLCLRCRGSHTLHLHTTFLADNKARSGMKGIGKCAGIIYDTVVAKGLRARTGNQKGGRGCVRDERYQIDILIYFARAPGVACTTEYVCVSCCPSN